MPKNLKLRQKIFLFFQVALLVSVLIVWVRYFSIGFGKFDKGNAVTIFGSVIQGMSALLSVAIAVVIFRILSLENSKQSLEQSTLNYIFQTTGWTYPIWASSVEAHIRNKSITNRYYLRIRKSIERVREVTKEEEEFQQEERDRQQERLEEALNRHSKIRNTIQRMKIIFLPSAIFLTTPILLSLFMLMVSNAYNPFWNFVFVSMVVLMSALGVALLIMIVSASTVETSEKSENLKVEPKELIRIEGKKMNEKTELLKIHIYVGYCHSNFRVLISFILGAFVAVLVSLVGLFYRNAFDIVTYYIAVFSSTPFFMFCGRYVYGDYRKNLGKVDNMIESVNKGEELPSIKDMLKGKGI